MDMAVAAYASLLSLTQVLNNVHNRAEVRSIHADIKQIETLREWVNYLVGFLEIHHQSEDERLKGLWSKISEIAFEAEEMFDLHVVNQLLERSAEQDKRDFPAFLEYLVNPVQAQEMLDLYKRSVVTGGEREDVMGSAKRKHKNDFLALSADEMIAVEFQEMFDLPVDNQLLQGSKKGKKRGLLVDVEIAFEGGEREDVESVRTSRARVEDKRDFLALFKDVESVIQKIDHIKTESPVVEVEEVQGDAVPVERQPKVSMSVGGKNVMVGFNEHKRHIMDELTSKERKLTIIPIIGMGGIGKTTLAKNVLEDPGIVRLHFDVRIWLTISQEYNAHEILTGLVNDGVVKRGSGDLESLKHNLYQKLIGRRYLIVMDDMWTIQAWDDFKRFFPDDKNGSRIMVTTRLEDVASSLGSCNPYSISFLDKKTSWNLFCQTIFGQEGCPFPELEEIGKRIASSCRGLPLEITAIGGLLANSNMTKEFWESVAENVSTLANSGYDEHCLQILFLSYKNLPIHLKPCFLCLRSYPEDSAISVHKLIRRWVVDGYIKPADGQSLEERAMEYLKDLISRNLIFIRVWNWDNKSCGVHDLFRDLCLRESDKQCFIHSPIVQRQSPICNIFIYRGGPSVCGLYKESYSNLTKPRFARITHEELLWEDDENDVDWAHEVKFIFPSLIHLLWNLQILEIHSISSRTILPKEIWQLPELRDIRTWGTWGAILPNPVDNDVEGEDFFILKNLRSLSRIVNLKFTKNVLDRIPNLNSLSIEYEDERSVYHFLDNLSRIETLETLFLKNYMLKGIVFPNSLKELSLSRCIFPWEDMWTIGLLRYLEKLSLYRSGVGRVWAPVEGQFLELRFLSTCDCDLQEWRANETHFPRLEKLCLLDLEYLEEIPLEIGDIDTLQTIELYDSENFRRSVFNSAKQIWEEQQKNGNDRLQFYIDGTLIRDWIEEWDRFKGRGTLDWIKHTIEKFNELKIKGCGDF